MPKYTGQQNVLRLRKSDKEIKENTRKTLIGLGITLLILFIIVGIAAIGFGGFDRLLLGTQKIGGDILDNITGVTPTPTATPTLFKFEIPQKTFEQQILENDANTMIFYSDVIDYNITIRKNTRLIFINNTGSPLGFVFSDGRTIKLETNDQTIEEFSQIGTITFSEITGDPNRPIRGKIHVIQ